MEGPSLHLAARQLQPFVGKKVLAVSGNTSIDKEYFKGQTVKSIFAWGKHLVFQFKDKALRVHFLLWGTYEARVLKVWVTGDYRRARVPRLALRFRNGEINIYNSSLKFLEEKHAKKTYDFSRDIMSPKWDPDQAYRDVRKQKTEQIADVLLDQELFAGVGNIIKNEVLSITYVHPKTRIEKLSPAKCKQIILETRKFSKQFLRWREKFELRANLKIHRKGTCPHCGTKTIREKTGKRERWAYWCPVCQSQK